jgi:hypothetical protein
LGGRNRIRIRVVEIMQLRVESVVGNVSNSKNEHEMRMNTNTFCEYSRGQLQRIYTEDIIIVLQRPVSIPLPTILHSGIKVKIQQSSIFPPAKIEVVIWVVESRSRVVCVIFGFANR